MTELSEKAEPIYELDDAHEYMLRPNHVTDRLTYIQVRGAQVQDLLRGMAAAAEHIRPEHELVGIDYNLIEFSGYEPMLTIVLQDRDDDGWKVADDGSYAIRVTTAR